MWAIEQKKDGNRGNDLVTNSEKQENAGIECQASPVGGKVTKNNLLSGTLWVDSCARCVNVLSRFQIIK
jgi:hypothetical protein